jgi:hypothetical protein
VTHQEEYEAEYVKLQNLLAERERGLVQILEATRRVVAWAILLGKPPAEIRGLETAVGTLKRGRLTAAIRMLLHEAATAPMPLILSTKDLVGGLRAIGLPLSEQNPEATVNALTNKLVKQKFARVVKRPDGRKAWVLTSFQTGECIHGGVAKRRKRQG